MSAEIRQGVEISFLHGLDRVHRGTVNGAPWVYWNGTEAEARVPVFCHALSNTIDVAGGNIVTVFDPRDAVIGGQNEPDDAPHSVKA